MNGPVSRVAIENPCAAATAPICASANEMVKPRFRAAVTTMGN